MSKFFKIFKNQTFKPKGKIKFLILKSSLFKLFVVSFILYLITVFFFSLFYYFIDDSIKDVMAGKNSKNILDIIYFSVITQSTVGFGDFIPNSSSRAFVAVQIITSIFLVSTLVSVLVFRILKSSPKIKFAKYFVFDVEANTFCFRFINLDSDDIVNAHISLFIRKRIPVENDSLIRHKTFRLKNTADSEPLIDSMRLVAFRSISGNIDLKMESDELCNIALSDFGEHDTMVIYISGSMLTSGDNIVYIHNYLKQDMKIGKFLDMERNLPENFWNNKNSWKELNFNEFDFVVPNSPALSNSQS